MVNAKCPVHGQNQITFLVTPEGFCPGLQMNIHPLL